MGLEGEITHVPMIDLTRAHREIAGELEDAMLRALRSGRYILGSEEQAFEREFADYIGAAHAIGVASGTDALFLILKALELGPGDEVVTTPFTFAATADVIANCGATPVFADIEPGTFNIDPDALREKVTQRTRALIAVHLFGQPAHMEPILEIASENGIQVIEDSAQATGAEYAGRKTGTLGDAAAFSFFPTKNLSCAGDGGMVVTDNADIADRVRMLRVHGSREKHLHTDIGINSRLDEVQAAMLRVKLRHLDRWNEARIRVASSYGAKLSGVKTPATAPERTHVFNQYTIRSERRSAIAERLAECSIGSAVYYHTPLHLQPCFSSLGYNEGDLPESERATKEVLSLPMFPQMNDEEIGRVCTAVNEALRADPA